MNYNDYKAIMEDEGLEESPTVKNYLMSAIYWNKAIKGLSKYEDDKSATEKTFTENKIKAILQAIEVARFEKNIGCRIDDKNAIEKVYQKMRG